MHLITVFFFGTLMDFDILKWVLGHPVPHKRLNPVLLPGHRRVRTAGRSYPHLQQNPARRTNGLMMRVTPEELALLDAYEGDEYRHVTARARIGTGGPFVAVTLYAPARQIRASHAPWRLDAWRHRGKSSLLLAIRLSSVNDLRPTY